MMRTKKTNKAFYRFILLIVFLLFIVGAVRFYWDHLLSPIDASDNRVQVFVINKGETTVDISKRLEQIGLIHSANAFNILVKRTGLSGKIQAGSFKLSASMSARQILDTLSTGGSLDQSVKLLEGWRVEQMADQLNRNLGIKKEAFLQVAKEGYMFPDTYSFSPDASAADIAQIMRNNFDKHYDAELQNRIRKQGLTPDQGVILASIVEREGRSQQVRTMVASILLKRLKIGMKLDVDATVQYAKDTQLRLEKIESFWHPITQNDYQGVISPFNTYLNAGLPPAPISNPSLSSLEAVANADSSTPYLYYYHDSQGNSYYAKTLDDHNANVANHR